MIVAERLTKSYGGLQVLRGATFTLSPDEILAVIGPSGCGKTTLLRVIAGLERPEEGRLVIDGAEVSSTSGWVDPHRRGVSMVFQDLALWPHMTAREQVRFVMRTDRLGREALRDRAEMILKDVRLPDHQGRYPHELSGGEKQRLAIARALASEPSYLLMDEPFAHLDPVLTEELQQLVLRITQDRGMGVIYVTHHPEEALQVTDQIAVMRDGLLARVDTEEAFENRRLLSHFSRCCS